MYCSCPSLQFLPCESCCQVIACIKSVTVTSSSGIADLRIKQCPPLSHLMLFGLTSALLNIKMATHYFFFFLCVLVI